MKLMLEEKNEEIISWRQRETANEGQFITYSFDERIFLYFILSV